VKTLSVFRRGFLSFILMGKVYEICYSDIIGRRYEWEKRPYETSVINDRMVILP
jgi:hypothetical protein